MGKFVLGGVLAVVVVSGAYAATTMSAAPADSWTVTNYYKQSIYDPKEVRIGTIDDVLVDKSGKVTGLVIGVDDVLESVRKHHLGLHSFRSMRRIDASLRKVSALRLRHSQSLASLRHLPSQAKVRSTIQRLGKTTKRWA